MTQIMTQLSVHMENRPGALAELTEALVDSGVNVMAISVPDTGEFGTVRVLTDDVDEARAVLQDGGFAHAAVDVLAVHLPHRPGALAKTARLLADGHVVIRYAYATIPSGEDSALCIVCVDDIHKAKRVLDKGLSA